ncbi:MAG TPA: VOC family protein [Pyrinomonadaceae bacterium]|nr:VOC family protein [Pyrinomonadaceae bacterium]
MNLNQVTIYTDKPVETAEFFEKLGLRLIVDSLPRYARLECPDGDSTLSIQDTAGTTNQSLSSDGERSANFSLQNDATLSSDSPTNLSLSSDRIVLYFECDDLDKTVADLKGNGLTFDEDPTDRPWLWRQAYLKDPNGNKICLFHAGENRKNPPWRVR